MIRHVYKCLILIFVFSSILSGYAQTLTLRKTWDGPYDIRMIAAPNLEPVYLNASQASGSKIKVDSIIKYATMMMSGTLLDINNRYKGGSPFNTVTLTKQAVMATDIDAPFMGGVPTQTPTSTCPVKYDNPDANPAPAVQVSMSYADYDTDLTTYASSMAQLDISKCSVIEAAYLYWTGDFRGTSPAITLATPTASYNGTGAVFDPTGTTWKTVKLKTPGGAYQNVTANFTFGGAPGANGKYLCVADVTAMLQGIGGGQFWVGNIQSYPNAETGGSTSSWDLVVIFKSPLSPPRRIALYDGFGGIAKGASQTYTLTGLTAPATSNFRSYVGYACLDGENITQESGVIGNQEGLGFQSKPGGSLISINPNKDDKTPYHLWNDGLPIKCDGTDNVDICKKPLFDANWCTSFDGISSLKIDTYTEASGKNGNPIVRLPSNPNTLTIDAHHMILPANAIAPNATSADLIVQAGPQGGTTPFLAYLAIEQLQPKLTLTKVADKAVVGLNADIVYTLRIKNEGNQASFGGASPNGDILSDTLDAATDYVPGSISYKFYKNGVVSAGTGTLISSAGNIMKVNINTAINPKDSVDIIFTVKTKDIVAGKALYVDGCKRTIFNTGWVNYKINVTPGDRLSAKSNSNDCGIGSEVKILIQDPALNATPTVLGPFTICPQITSKASSLSEVRKRLFAAGVAAADTADYDVRDQNYVRVRPTDAFPAIDGSFSYHAILDLGGSGPNCQKIYEIQFTCASCAPPTALAISPKPVSPATVLTFCEGSSQIFTSTYTLGTPKNGSYYITYFKDGLPLGPAAVIANGSTTNALPVSNMTTAMSGKYKVRIEDGNTSNKSCYKEDSVTIVVDAVVVKGAISANQVNCGPFVPAALASVTPASGGSSTGTITYTWQSSANGTAWTDIASTNAAGYAPGNRAATTYYRRKAASGVCPAVFTDSVIITINAIPARPTAITGISPACPSSILSIAGAPPAGIAYYWQGTSATSKLSTLPATATYEATASGKYYARAQNTTTLCWSDSTLIDIVINPLTPGVIGDNTPLCDGVAIPKIVSKSGATGGNGTFAYQWESTTDTVAGTWSNIAGATAVDYTPGSLAQTTYYRRKVTSGTCPNVTQIVTYTFSPKPGPAGPITGPDPLCVNATGNFSIAAVANATSYDWTVPAGASITTGAGTTAITVSFTATPGGAITVTPKNACGTGAPSTVNVTINPNLTPAVTIQGPSNICAGSLATFFVQAATDSGATPSYEWFVNATKQASTKTFFTSTTLVNGDKVSVVMTSSETCVTTPTATSNIITIAVVTQVRPKVSVTPVSFCAGVSTTLTATPEEGGTAPIYAWELNGAPVGTNSNSYTSSTFANGDQIKVTMISNSGCASPNTADTTVTLNVKPVPVLTPSSATLCSGSTTSISLTTTPNVAGTTYSWPAPVSATVTGAALGTTSSITHQLKTTSVTPQVVNYVVTPAANGCVGQPVTIPVTVNPTPTATAVNDTLCSGTATNIAINSNVAGATFTWTAAPDPAISGSGSGSGSPIAETLTSIEPSVVAVNYTIIPIANGCPGTPVTVKALVTPIPVATTLPAPDICSGGTGNVQISSSVVGATTTYAWTSSGTAGVSSTAPSSGTSNPISQKLDNTGMADGTMTYTITPTANGCVGLPVNADVKVKPIPVAQIGGLTPICGGSTSKVWVSSNTAGTTYTWTMAPTGTVSGTPTSGSVTDTIKQVLTNTGNNPGTALYTVLPTANGCTGLPVSQTITVNPAPDAKATDVTICSGVVANIPVTTSSTGMTVTYAWTSTSTTGTVSGSAGTGTGNNISETLSNAGTANAVQTYTITPTANGCTGQAKLVTATVKPIPVISSVNNKKRLCSSESTSIDISSSVTGTLLTIIPTGGSGSSTLSNVTAPQNVAQALSTTTTAQIIYTSTPTANGCVGLAIKDTVTVYPNPPSDAGTDVLYCDGDSANLGTATNSQYKYVWSPSTGLSSDTVSAPQTRTTATTSYTVTTSLRANSSCSSTDNVVVNVIAKFTVNAGPDQTICAKDPVTLSATPGGLLSYIWNTGGKGATINVAPEDTTIYTVVAFNGACVATDTVVVFVKNFKNPSLFIPNSFSPNGDGANDIFRPIGEGIIELEGMIFNRWGELYHTWTDVNGGWNGELKTGDMGKDDVYIYSIRVKNLCDKKFNPVRSGTVTIIK